jgi:hypothetical protein
MGILIQFYSREHEPIHIHAIYRDAVVKVYLYVKDGVVHRVRYEAISGKFSPAKMRDLKAFVAANKNVILFAWKQFFEHKVKIKPVIITKRIK